jgi:O-antigen ligase
MTDTAGDPKARRELISLPAIAAVGFFVMGSVAFVPLIEAQPDGGPSTGAILQVFWSVSYLGALAFFLTSRGRAGARSLGLDWRAPSLIALALISAIWSQDPALTIQRAIGLTGTALCAYFLASCLRPDRLLELLRFAVLLCVIASLVLFFIAPTLATDTDHLTLRGVFSTKNVLGRTIALGLATEALLYVLKQGRIWVQVVIIVIYAWALALSGSASPIAVTVVLVAVLLLTTQVLLVKSMARYLVVGFSIAWITVLQFGYGSLVDAALGALGRDTTLSSRADIWAAVWTAIEHAPVLGWGFGAFWLGDRGPSGVVWDTLSFDTPHAHNGFLDIWLQTGIVGVVLVLLVIGYTFRRGLSIASVSMPRGLPVVGIVAFCVAANITESSLFDPNSVLTLLLFYVIFVSRRNESPPESARINA